jgi:hypothetical protein
MKASLVHRLGTTVLKRQMVSTPTAAAQQRRPALLLGGRQSLAR